MSGPQEAVVNDYLCIAPDVKLGASVKLARAGQVDIQAANVSVSPAKIKCELDLSGVATGAWNVVVINPDGQAPVFTRGTKLPCPE